MDYRHDLNLDQATRDRIIWGESKDGGNDSHRQFKALSLEQLKQLLDGNFVFGGTWNSAPGAKEIYDWAVENAGGAKTIYFSGYAIGLNRSDYRVTVDAIRAEGCTGRFRDAFIKQWGQPPDGESSGEGYWAANEFHTSRKECKAWWD